MESATRGGSFSTRSRLGKAVAGSGLRGQDERDQWKQTGCARKMEENGWRHVFGAKIGARNERTVFFLGIQRERLAWKVQPGEARFGAELDWVKPWRGQVFGARLCTRNERKDLFFSRDSEGAFGMESTTTGGSFSTRIRLGKAVAGSGLRGQDERDQWKQTRCARKMEENGWRHVFGAKIGARNERPVFFLGIQRERLAWKVQPGEARFGPELDWEKPWRGQVFGAKMSETNGNKLDAREKRKKTVGGTCSGLRLAQEMREQFFF